MAEMRGPEQGPADRDDQRDATGAQEPGGSLQRASFGNESQISRHATMNVLERNQDLDRFRALHWQGSMADYFDIVREHPEVTRTANRRLYDMIISEGSFQYEKNGQKLIHFNFFDDPHNKGKEAVFGLDENIMQLMKMLKSAAFGYGTEKRILLLRGPVGSAKSTLARLMKRGLERYSESDAGAIYTFGWKNVDFIDRKEGLSSVEADGEDKNDGSPVLWSPMNEDPLALIPAEHRARMLEHFNAGKSAGDYRVHIPEKGLSPFSRFYFDKLMEHYEGDITRVLDHVVTKRVVISEQDRIGIGTYQPKDSKNQDTTELTGDINFRKIARYGSDSDPRAFNFDGEFCVANRGMIEFVEMLKLDLEMLYTLLEASQSREIKPKKFSAIGVDQVIIGHTNEPEYEKLKNNKFMEALRDRTVVVDVPYVTTVSDEMKVYEKDYNPSRIAAHIAPHTIEVASQFAVLSRLEAPKKADLTALQKMKLYDGKAVANYAEDHVAELRQAAEREGLDGLSPRFIQDTLNECLVESDDQRGISAFQVLNMLEQRIPKSTHVNSEEEEKRLKNLLAMVREEFEQTVKLEVQLAISHDENALKALAEKYIQNVSAFLSRTKVKDPHTNEKVEPDERFMRSIERKMGISEKEAHDVRRSVLETIGSAAAAERAFDPLSNDRLRKALEQKLFEDRRDQISLQQYATTIVDKEAQEKIDILHKRLKEKFGYNDYSATDVLKFVASVMARGSTSRDE